MSNHERENTNSLKESLIDNELFQKLTVPIVTGKFPEIRDAEFFIRQDGSVVNAEGWYHPEGMILGEILYVPDPQGDRTIFGLQYKKVTLFQGTLTPVPYDQRAGILSQYDDSLNQVDQNPYYAKYKQLFSRRDFIAYLPARPVLLTILSDPTVPSEQIKLDLANSEQLLDIDLDDIDIGLTGSLLLGNSGDFHDLDLVFQGSLKDNISIAKKIRALVKQNPSRRVIEGGKGWGIRYYNDRGTLMCNFFTYKNPEDAPLRDFRMDVIEEDVLIEAEVTDDIHSIYTPTVLSIGNVSVVNEEKQKTDVSVLGSTRLIAYHTATRGECFRGDKVRARGALVNIKTPQEEHKAICVIEREGIRNMTPAWEDYYNEPEIT